MTPIGVPFPVQRYRVMFHDGETTDYLAGRDGSDFREYALREHYGTSKPDALDKKLGKNQAGIMGVAWLGEVYTYTPEMPLDDLVDVEIVDE